MHRSLLADAGKAWTSVIYCLHADVLAFRLHVLVVQGEGEKILKMCIAEYQQCGASLLTAGDQGA